MKNKTNDGEDRLDDSISSERDDDTDGDIFPLTKSERRVIRNYRLMKHSAQQTFADISEELAIALPATKSPGPGCSSPSR